MSDIYRVDCIRFTNGEPVTGWSRPWFVQRISDGATLAQCSTREAAERSMAKRIAKDRAAEAEDQLDDPNWVGSRWHY